MENVVGRGTLLAGRYRTREPLASDLPGATTWEATDQILDRPVRVTVLHAGQVPQALDAARRAALVTDPRLVRVLDVGEHAGVAYTVTEQVAGPSLDELVARGPLPADQARAIIGEAASALEAARRRGVHHLALRPSALHLTPDDRVLLTGLAVDGALLGNDTTDADAASRADTVGLVELLYAALTGRWPGTARRPGRVTDEGPLPHLAAAPVLEGAPVAPAEVASGVPNDLDTLCAVTLGVHDDGPRSPAELVQELEPWGDIRATDLFAGTQVLPAAPFAPDRTAPLPTSDVPATPARVQRTSVRTAFAGGSSAVAARPGTPPPAVPSRASSLSPAAGAPAAARGAGRPRGDDAPTTALPVPDDAETTALPATGAPPTDRTSPTGASPTARDDAATTAMPRAAATPDGATTGRTPAVTPDDAPTRHVPAPAERPASTPSRPSPPVRPATPARAAAATAATAATAAATATASSSATAATSRGAPARDDLDPAPLLPLGPRPGGLDVSGARDSIAAHRFDPTRLVLLLVGLAIVVGLFTAYRALTQPVGPPTTSADPAPTAQAPAEEPAGEPAEEPAEPEPEPEPAAPATTPVIASAAQLDPPPGGDENEHPEAVPLAIDGDPATVWFTRTYSQPNFGGLKPGVGYAVTLAEPAVVSTVTLQVQGTGGRVEVRATDPTTPTEGPVLAEGALGPQTVLTLTEPTEAQHVVLWFTELPQTADGSNRIELAEVALS